MDVCTFWFIFQRDRHDVPQKDIKLPYTIHRFKTQNNTHIAGVISFVNVMLFYPNLGKLSTISMLFLKKIIPFLFRYQYKNSNHYNYLNITLHYDIQPIVKLIHLRIQLHLNHNKPLLPYL